MIKGEEWKEQANCLDLDFNDFFDNYEESNEVQLRVDRTCANCVVRNQCLEWAIENNLEGGVFGRKFIAQGNKKRKRRKSNAGV